MSKYNRLGNNEFPNTQDPLSPPRPLGNGSESEKANENLTPNSALPIVKNKIFEMYDIHSENENSQDN